jgi:hypothetical protein
MTNYAPSYQEINKSLDVQNSPPRDGRPGTFSPFTAASRTPP